MSYRPITDVMLLARPKVKFYGSFPSGFLSRARDLLGVTIDDPVLHVCAGAVRVYPYAGFGRCDRTVDVDDGFQPDWLLDITANPLPMNAWNDGEPWAAVLCDPPYTRGDAEHYIGTPGFPTASCCLSRSLAVVRPGGRVGILHYEPPRPPKGVKLVALLGVVMGFGNNIRCYSVYERGNA